MVQSFLDEKVSDIIERYRNKANDFDQTRKFKFNAKMLIPNLTLEETGITNNDHIFVV